MGLLVSGLDAGVDFAVLVGGAISVMFAGLLLRVTRWWMNWLCFVLLLSVALIDEDGKCSLLGLGVSTL
jgi:hypothetical protein